MRRALGFFGEARHCSWTSWNCQVSANQETELLVMNQPPMPTTLPSAQASAAALHASIGLLLSGHARSTWKHCSNHSTPCLLILDRRVCSADASAMPTPMPSHHRLLLPSQNGTFWPKKRSHHDVTALSPLSLGPKSAQKKRPVCSGTLRGTPRGHVPKSGSCLSPVPQGRLRGFGLSEAGSAASV